MLQVALHRQARLMNARSFDAIVEDYVLWSIEDHAAQGKR